MAEYIEREALWRAFEHEQFYDNADRDEIVLPKIDSFQSADVSPARPGRWLSWDELHGRNTPAKNVLGVFCSECIRQSDSKTRFCPNCGARMDKEDSQCDT